MLELEPTAENFALLDKIRNFLQVICSLSIFFLGNTRTSWDDAPSLIKDIFLLVNMLSRFEVTRFQLMAVAEI